MMRITKVPVLDRTACAGRPADPDDDYQIVGYEYMPTPFTDNPDDKFVVCVVRGDSMKDAGILSGHWVMFQLCEDVPAGALSVVATPDGVTIKFYEPQENGTVDLVCANKDYENRTWLKDEVQIRGIVVHTGQDWRKYHKLLITEPEPKEFRDLEYVEDYS